MLLRERERERDALPRRPRMGHISADYQQRAVVPVLVPADETLLFRII